MQTSFQLLEVTFTAARHRHFTLCACITCCRSLMHTTGMQGSVVGVGWKHTN